jgi:hypothetical protein
MQKDTVCGCCGARRPDSRAQVILTPEEAEKAAALNDNDLFWATKAEGLLEQVKADMEKAER